MDGTTITQFLNQWLDVFIDIGLITAFFFLWLSWYRNGKRQKQLEQLLIDTAGQLEEASQHLADATQAIEQLKKQERQHEQHSARRPAPVKPARTKQPQVTSNQIASNQIASNQIASNQIASNNLPPQNSTQATMILRMKREGESPQTIAERLDMPLAQVKLLLKLNAASSSIEE